MGWGRYCGFDDWPPGAWSPKDLEAFMRLHAQHGAPYHEPGFHSGYNEVIITSKSVNANLPRSIEAFFVLSKAQARRDGVGVQVARAHREFLSQYQLSTKDVPLLLMRPWNWEEPFVELDSTLFL